MKSRFATAVTLRTVGPGGGVAMGSTKLAPGGASLEPPTFSGGRTTEHAGRPTGLPGKLQDGRHALGARVCEGAGRVWQAEGFPPAARRPHTRLPASPRGSMAFPTALSASATGWPACAATAALSCSTRRGGRRAAGGDRRWQQGGGGGGGGAAWRGGSTTGGLAQAVPVLVSCNSRLRRS